MTAFSTEVQNQVLLMNVEYRSMGQVRKQSSLPFLVELKL